MPINAYPNDENYPTPSFRRPVTAPDVEPDEGAVVIIGLNAEWIPVVEGALDQLMLPSTWEGTHDEINTALNRAANLKMLVGAATVGDVPAPFWDEDSGDDSDDIAPVDEQPWYGQIVIIDDNLTFVENAFIYVVAGFIAYAGLPTAAISFVPIARKFVVTMKSNPLGGIVRFLADATEIGRVDTYSAADGVVEAPIVMPPPTMGFVAEDVTYPTLWVELLEDNPHSLESVSMTLIRSRLSESDFSPPNLRYNPDTDTVQFTPDGGTTWYDAPGADPRHSDVFRLPALAGEDARCNAAANMVKWMKDFLDSVTELLETGAILFAIVNKALELMALVFDPSVLLLAITEVCETIFGIGGTALLAAFSGDTYDLLLCCFYCNLEVDGSATADDLVDVENQVTLDLNTTAALVVNALLFIQGEVGLSNAGVIGGQTGDCSECDCSWCFQFDEATGLEDWGHGASGGGSWDSGLGRWAGTDVGSGGYGTIYAVDITKSFTATAVSSVSTRFGCQYNDGGRPTTILYLSGSQVGRVDAPYSQGEVQTDVTFDAEFADVVCDEIRVYMASGGGCSVDQVTTTGPDTNPFGANNC